MSQSALKTNGQTDTKIGIQYWWKIVAVMFLGWVFIYATRTILNPVMPNIANEFSLSNAQLGLINSVFFLTYAFAQVPSGSLGDKFGRKYILVPGFILFGLFTGLTGLAMSFAFFMFARAIAGLGQGTFYGPCYAIAADSIPQQNRTMGTAIINSGMAIGTSLGYITSSYLTLERGISWEIPFYIMTIPTVLVGVLIWFTVKEKRRKLVNETSVAASVPVEKVKISEILRNRNIICTFIMAFCSLYGFFMILTWLPQFLQTERGFAGSEVGFISSLIPWASIPGALLFGYLTDKIGRTKPLIFFLVPLAAFSIFAVVYIKSIPLMVIALIVYGLTGKLALDPVLISFVSKNAPQQGYSTVFGLFNFVGMSSSILAPYITGYLTDTTGSMQTGFFLAMILLIVGFVAMLFAKEEPTKKTAA
ncbi:MFS transporter [Peribacillus sp. NPDC094092]|uniref:MFS transporter n=1 Tax=Peribacillus sp. NPDC094092 TaxID=3390611 RepID=UPI003D04B367